MSDDRASPNAPGPRSPAGQIEAARSRFETAWKTGRRPRIEDFAGPDSSGGPTADGPSAQQRELLWVLVGVDLEYRWRPAAIEPTRVEEAAQRQQDSGASPDLPARPRLENYVARLPALGPLDELPLDLIVEEYRVRHRWGDHPSHDEYLIRFGRRAELRQMLTRTDGELASGETIGHPALLDSGWDTQRKTSPASPVEPRRLGDYELHQRLGRGGMGVVYKARHVLLNQIVALKVLPEKYLDEPQAVSRFRREMQLIGALDHPNIVQARNAGEHQGVHYLVMEFVDGITLEQLSSSPEEPLPVGAACELVRQAALGLQHAHLHGLVHRDVKPANLMLSADGTVKILDLGLARLRADQQAARQLSGQGVSEPGIAIGTVDYMAPEQWEDSSSVDIRADIYSLGCTLFQLLTGKPPYGPPRYDSIRKKLKAHATEPVPSIAEHRNDCPKELDRLLGRMMAKATDDRFATPAEVADAIGRFADTDELLELLPASIHVSGQSAVASDPGLASSGVDTWKKGSRPSWRRPRPSSRRRRGRPWYTRPGTLAAAGAMVAVVLAVSAWWIVRGGSRPSPSPLQQQLCEDLGSLPGLKGRWWFDEIPWFVPAVRASLIEAVNRRDREISGISPGDLAAMVRSSDVDALYGKLEHVANEFKKRVPNEQQRRFLASVEASLSDRDQISPESYRQKLGKVKTTLEQMRGLNTPTALHYRAVVQHELARYELAEWSDAEADYETALRRYDEWEHPAAKVLRALCMADLGQMSLDARQYQDSVSSLQEARRSVDAPAMVIASLCQQADASRKIPTKKALECLREAEAYPGLPEDHPLRAHVHERRAWVQMDTWRFSKAIESFNKALEIRARHEDPQVAGKTLFALWNRQGVAMAYHFLGEKEKVTAEFTALLRDIPGADTPAGHRQRRISERGPNVYECYADWFLFGPQRSQQNYQKAADLLAAGIRQTEYLHFENDFRAPYVLRLRFKRRLALALSARSDQDLPPTAADLDQLADQYVDKQDREIFAEARDVAAKVAALQAAPAHDPQSVQPLYDKIARSEPTTQLARNKLGFPLLAIELVCDCRVLKPQEVQKVTQRMIEIVNVTSMGGDQAGIRKFLRRYLEAVQRELNRVGDASGGVDLSKDRQLIEEWLR